MSTEYDNYEYISNSQDYRHLQDRNRYKALYDEVGTVEANRVIQWREEWMKHFKPRPGATILELGAHNGPNLLHYARRGHATCGVEISDTLIETFESALQREPAEIRQRVRLHRGWIEDFTPDVQYDEVLCTEILEHVADPVAVLYVASSALKPTGRVYISSPKSHWGNNTHVRGVPVEDLRQWLDLAGLQPIEIWSEDDRTFCIAHKSESRVVGMIRVRNESTIIRDTLDHMARFCSGGIYVYDDVSTDDTVSICLSHPSVRGVVRGAFWDSNRGRAEYENRAAVLRAAQNEAHADDWLVYLDADERVEFDWSELFSLPSDVIGVRMKLFDFYITPEDVSSSYRDRQWIGPEYRRILIAFRNHPSLIYRYLDQREVELGHEGRVVEMGAVKHYGKAISIEQWEHTCDYYKTYFPAYAAKWAARKGKAVHTKSDFGQELIRWEQRDDRGVLLTPEIETVAQPVSTANQEKKLKILLATHQLLDFTGSELFTFTLADFLRRDGHEVTVYSPYIDKFRPRFESIGVRITESLQTLRVETFDVAHIHHNITAMEVRHIFPTLPIVFLSHGVIPFLEQAPAVDLQISRFLAISEEVQAALVNVGIGKKCVQIFRNIVDSQRFSPASSIRPTPQSALILSARLDERRERIIREACAKLDITPKFLGGRFGEVDPSKLPLLMNEADIVFSLGRGAIEAMMCARIPIVFDYLGGDGMVQPENLLDLAKCNFSGRRYAHDYTVDDVTAEISKYRQENGSALRALALDLFDAEHRVRKLVDIYSACAEMPVGFASRTDGEVLKAFVGTITETRSYTYNRFSRTSVEVRLGRHSNVRLALPAVGHTFDDWREAIRQLESQLWLNEADPATHHELALLHYHLGDKMRALPHLQRAAALSVDNPQVCYDLNVLYREIVESLMADLGGKTEHAANLQVHANNLETDIRRLASAHQAWVREKKAIGRQLERSERRRKRLEQERERLISDLLNASANQRSLASDCEKLEAENSRLDLKHQKLQAEIHEVQSEWAEAVLKRQKVETQCEQLEHERDHLARVADSQRQQMTRLRMDLYTERMNGLVKRIRRDGFTEIVVYGAGEVGHALVAACLDQGLTVRCAIDRNASLWGRTILGVPVVSFDEALRAGVDLYAIASFSFAQEISREIQNRYEGTVRTPRVYLPLEHAAPAVQPLVTVPE